MKQIGAIAVAVKDKIKVAKKAPKKERADEFAAARRTAPPLAVLSSRIFDNLDILRDANALAVLVAICNHASKAGITQCSQERIAALTRLSRKTVNRKVKKLVDAKLLRIEYKRPYQGSPKRLNIMRVIYDDGTLTRQDAAAIASAPTGQHAVPQARAGTDKLSTTTDSPAPQPASNTASPMGQQKVPQVDSMAILRQVPDSPMGQIGLSTYGTDEKSHKQAKALNNKDIIEVMNRELARYKAPAIEPTAEALATVNGSALTESQIIGAVADYLLACQDNRQPPAPTVQAILAEVVALH